MTLQDISIRNELKPGDIGYLIYLHGKIYSEEQNYGVIFETYVAQGLCEFFNQYNPGRNRVWVCEHQKRMVGFMLLMDRGESAQLRYFIIEPDYRGMGLGKKLMLQYFDFMKSCGYKKSFLWTAQDLPAAASLYTRHGFVLTEEKESIAFGKSLKELRYDLQLA